MDQAVQHLDTPMTVAQFLAWHPPDNRMWQLVDGTRAATVPSSRPRQALLGGIHGHIRAHLLDLGSTCSSLPTAGIITPKHADRNLRIPDLAVTYSDPVNNLTDTPAPSWSSRSCFPVARPKPGSMSRPAR